MILGFRFKVWGLGSIRRPWGACWMVAEGPLPFSLTAPKRGGGGGGVGGVSRLRFPPGPHLRSSRFSRNPRLRQARAWIPPLSALNFLQAKFLTSCCVSNPWVRVSKRYHNPQSADLGGRWMVSEGGAVQFHERRGSRLRSSISAAGPGPKPLGTWPTSP